MTRIALVLSCLIASACSGDTGTISVTLVTGPERAFMDRVHRARLTLSNPPAVVETTRDAQGALALALDVPVESRPGTLTFEGFDEDGAPVAFGRSGLLPIAAITVDIAIHVAPPLSVTEAPARLAPPRADMGVAPLTFGVVLAGGRTDGGASDAVSVYSIYTHTLEPGAPLAEPRIAPTAAPGAGDVVYLFGGLGPEGAPRDQLSVFHPGIGVAGVHVPLSTEGEGLARAGAHAAPLGQDLWVVTGDPLVLVDGIRGRAGALASAPALEGTATSAFVNGAAHTLFAGAGSGESGAVMLVGAQFTELAPPAAVRAELRRAGHTTVLLPDGSMLMVAGDRVEADGPTPTAAALRFWPAGQTFERIDGFLGTARSQAAVAATAEHVVVAGGVDRSGALAGDVEVFDARTLARVAVLPLVVPRRGAAAAPLSNGQVLIAGGVDRNGAAVAVMELFTPAP